MDDVIGAFFLVERFNLLLVTCCLWLVACWPSPASPVVIPREANPKAFGERRGPPERAVRYRRGTPEDWPALRTKREHCHQYQGISRSFLPRNDGLINERRSFGILVFIIRICLKFAA